MSAAFRSRGDSLIAALVCSELFPFYVVNNLSPHLNKVKHRHGSDMYIRSRTSSQVREERFPLLHLFRKAEAKIYLTTCDSSESS